MMGSAAGAAVAPSAGDLRTSSPRRGRGAAIRGFKLARRTFGGRAGALVVTFRLARTQRAIVDVRRGRKVVRRVSDRMRRGWRTQRLRISARGLPRSQYRIRLRAGGATATLPVRRL